MARGTLGAIMSDAPVHTSAQMRPRLVAPNTVEYMRPDLTRCIRFHHTDILEFRPDGTVALFSGGWRTPTTKERINRFAPVTVTQGRGLWYVGDIPFYEGILVTAAGEVLYARPEVADGEKALGRAILKFVRLFDAMETLPRPDNGDCWYCLMFDQERGNFMGWRTSPAPGAKAPSERCADHLRAHLRDGYLHGSLIVNAMRWAGYTDHGIAIHYSMADRRPRTKYDIASVKSALRRYLRHRLGLAQ